MENSLGIKSLYKKIYCIIRDGQNDWLVSPEDIHNIASEVIDALFRDLTIADKCQKNFLKDSEKLLDLLERNNIIQRKSRNIWRE